FTWLAVLLERAARVLGTTGLELFPTAIAMTGLVAVAAVWWLGPRSPWLLAAVVFALMGAAGPYMGQGEHIAVMLALPYLFASSVAVTRGLAVKTGAEPDHFGDLPKPSSQIAVPVRLAIASAAAVGLAMKPHFALVWL